MTHYRELLGAAKAGGYQWVGFDHGPQAGDLFLRHDVDLSLDAAVEMGQLEHELGVTATYFIMAESVFYNLDSTAGIATLRELRRAPPYFVEGQYRSDSNANWRESCPHEELAASTFDWVQLNVHPVIWMYRSETMRQTMDAMLDAKRAEWFAYLANDRIDLS